MAPDIHTFALLLLFARGNSSYFTEGENITAPTVSEQYIDAYGRPHYYSKCDDDDDCGSREVCVYGRCRCDYGFYYRDGCEKCPGFGEDCWFAKCCDSLALYCGGNLCRCRDPGSKECSQTPPHNDSGFRMVNAFQIILAAIFSVALFALLIQCWRTCCGKKILARRPAIQDSSRPAVVDVEGITTPMPPLERLSTVARDAPPRYDDLSHFQFEKPPPYLEAVNFSPYFQEGRQSDETLPRQHPTAPMEDSSRGVNNAAFSSDDQHSVATPPHVDSVPEDRYHSSVAATGDRQTQDRQYTACPDTVDTGAGGGVVASPDTARQLSASLKEEQSCPPVTAANSAVVCQVHRTES